MYVKTVPLSDFIIINLSRRLRPVMGNGLLKESFCGAFYLGCVQSRRDPAAKASTECLKGDSSINYRHFFRFNDSLYYLIYFYSMLHIWLVTMFVFRIISIKLTVLEKRRRGHFVFRSSDRFYLMAVVIPRRIARDIARCLNSVVICRFFIAFRL